MLGSLANQQLYASANSIAAVPNVWAEWNYNSFAKPDVTNSGDSINLAPLFMSTSLNNWTSVGGTLALDTANGYYTQAHPSYSAIAFSPTTGVSDTSIVPVLADTMQNITNWAVV
jgi:hypothetical protein